MGVEMVAEEEREDETVVTVLSEDKNAKLFPLIYE